MENNIFYLLTTISVSTILIVFAISTIKRYAQSKNLKKNERYIPMHNALINFNEQEYLKSSISRELHDNVGQLLSLTQMNLHYLSKATNGDFRYNKITRDTISILDQIYDSIQHISHKLNADFVNKSGLISMLKQEATSLKIAKNISVVLNIDGNECRLKEDVELSIFRIAQESLRNIIKHAQATEVIISMNYSADYLHMAIKDNGIGFEMDRITTDNTSGIGLASMHHRAASICATLNIISSQDGTTIQIELASVYAYKAS
ncbi:MAG: hypothetical protein JNK00_13150 [Flavipsychrobacter sp.]|nr:hypothetical protein [Flavipsychrobacter sp.]